MKVSNEGRIDERADKYAIHYMQRSLTHTTHRIQTSRTIPTLVETSSKF